MLINGGFVTWVSTNFWPSYTMRMFLWFNAGAVVLIGAGNIAFDLFGARRSASRASRGQTEVRRWSGRRDLNFFSGWRSYTFRKYGACGDDLAQPTVWVGSSGRDLVADGAPEGDGGGWWGHC
jgi:hypothetical protein